MNSQKTKKIAPNITLSRANDVPLLLFLWRWKVSTTSAMHRMFYPKRSAHAAYLRLWKLEKGGFIKSRVDETARDYMWTLDKRGYAFVHSRIPHMKDEGYLSENLAHDLVVTAIHLGEGIFGSNGCLEYFTEQELRRIDPAFFPPWVPDSGRRPDGYWAIQRPGGRQVVALEVELSAKVDSEYESIARFYDETEEIHQVIWVVNRPSVARKIHDCMQEFSRKAFKHSFVLLEPVYNNGWQAPVYCGLDTGKTLNSLLQNSSLSPLELVFGQFSLDTRKTPHKSKHCELFRP